MSAKIAGSILIGLLWLELCIRVGLAFFPNILPPIQFGGAHPRGLIRQDSRLGYTLTPGFRGRETNDYREYHIRVSVSSQGLRDREHDLSRKRSYRILGLGDSFTAQVHVKREHRFTEILEKDLNQRKCFSSKKVEVMNFGVSDYGTAQELMVLRDNVWPYDPDMVILAFWPMNDLDDNLKELSYTKCRPYAVFRDGKLEFDNSFRSLTSADCGSSKTTLVLSHSRVFQLARQAYMEARRKMKKYSGSEERIVKEKISTLRDMAESPQFISIHHESGDEKRRQSWKVTDNLISIMNQEVKEKGAEFIVVSLGTMLQVTPDISVRKILLENTGTDNLFYPGERIRSIGQREGFAVLDLAPPFQQFADEHQVYLHKYVNDNGQVTPYGHWTEQANQLAAKIISDKLCQKQ